MQPKFSIIVAVYNIEKYIAKCIESVLNQTFSNFELLLIDDESIDNSMQIAEQYADRDGRIKLLSHPHGGLPSTRNVGLRAASGEYIVILDGDDFFETSHLERVARVLEEKQCDMCISNNYMRYWEDRTEYVELFPCCEELNKLSLEKQLALISNIDYYMPASAWLTVYANSFLKNNKLLYDESLKCSEDTDFFLLGLSKAKSIKFTSHRYYYYRQDNVSAMTKNMTSDMYLARLSMYEKWIKYYKERKIDNFECNAVSEYLRKEFCIHMHEIVWHWEHFKRSTEFQEFMISTQYIWAPCPIHIVQINIGIIWIRIFISKIRGAIRGL